MMWLMIGMSTEKAKSIVQDLCLQDQRINHWLMFYLDIANLSEFAAGVGTYIYTTYNSLFQSQSNMASSPASLPLFFTFEKNQIFFIVALSHIASGGAWSERPGFTYICRIEE